MKVKDLIEELKKCNPEDTVYYDFENAFTNEVNCSTYPELYPNLKELKEDLDERLVIFTMGVDDVLIGSGTLKGYVYLTEDLIEEEKNEVD